MLAAYGARVQRLLWASTGTKNPAYPDTLYVDSLIGGHTVNTIPPTTLEAFLDHGTIEATLNSGQEKAEEELTRLARLGIDIEAICERLQEDGVASFVESFEALKKAIAGKVESASAAS